MKFCRPNCADQVVRTRLCGPEQNKGTRVRYRLQAEAAAAAGTPSAPAQADGAHGPIVQPKKEDGSGEESGSSDESSGEMSGMYTGMFAALSNGFKKSQPEPKAQAKPPSKANKPQPPAKVPADGQSEALPAAKVPQVLRTSHLLFLAEFDVFPKYVFHA